MAGTTVKIKQSAVVGKVPASGSLLQGELALNTADQRLYSKDSTGTVFEIGGGSGGGANEIITTEFTASAGQTSFAALYNVLNDHVNVYYNGMKLIASDYVATTGTEIVLTDPALIDDIVTVEVIKALNLANGSDITEHEFTASAGQTSFAIPNGGYNKISDNIEVFVNGIKLLASVDFIHTDGTNVVLTDPADLDDEVTIKHIKVIALAGVVNSSGTSAIIPAGATADRDTSPEPGYLRWNTDLNSTEVYNGSTSTWDKVGFIDAEEIEDIVGSMVGSNTETNIVVTYDDATGKLNFAVSGLAISDTTGLQTALDGKVDDAQVLTNVPTGALFTDTIYTHPTNHPISLVTGLQTALDGKVDDAQVLTNVPTGALFTDTIYTHPTNHAISVITGLQTALDGKVDDAQVLTNVPTGALFTDTIYNHPANHPISLTTGLQAALDSKLNLSGGTLTGNLTAVKYYGDGSSLTGISTDNFYVNGIAWSGGYITLTRNGGLTSLAVNLDGRYDQHYNQATAPTAPTLGDGWYDTTDGTFYKYINDNTNNLWVDISTAGAGGQNIEWIEILNKPTLYTQSEIDTAISLSVSNLVDSAPTTLNTLNELALALGDDANHVTTMTNLINTKLPLTGGTLSGSLTIDGGGTISAVNTTDLKIIATDDLFLQAVDNIYIQPQGNDNGITLIGNGAVTLHHDSNPKLATTSTGINVTGKVTCDSLTVEATGGDMTTIGHSNGNRIQLQPSYNYHQAYEHVFSSLSNTTEYMRIKSDGKVGIGTNNPNKPLQIGGATPAIRLEETGTGGSKRLDLWVDSTAVARIGANQSAQSLAFETTGTERLIINSSGHFGIGTAPHGDYQLKIAATGTNDAAIYAIGNGSGRGIVSHSPTGIALSSFTDSGYAGVFQGGNVGIGTTTPDTLLHLNTTTTGAITTLLRLEGQFNSNSSNEGTAIDFVTGSEGTSIGARIIAVRTAAGARGELRFCTGRESDSGFDNGRMIIDETGDATFKNDVTIQGNLTLNGTTTIVDTDTTTTEQWNVTNDGTGPAVTINQTGLQPIINIQDDGSSVFYIEDGGNVGIGTKDPTSNLDVRGDVTINNHFGPQLVTNGGFSTWSADVPSNWELGSFTPDATSYVTESVINGNSACRIVGADDANGYSSYIVQSGVFPTANSTYEVGYEIKSHTEGSIRFKINGTDYTLDNELGFHSFTTTNGIDTALTIRGIAPPFDLTIDNVSVKEVLTAGDLDVTGDVTVTGTITADGIRTDTTNVSYNLLTRNSSNTSTYIQQSGTGNILDARYGSTLAGQGTSAMVITSTGDVGIGTTTPTTELEVKDSTGNSQICITSSNTSESVINMGDVDDINIQRIRSNHTSNYLSFETNNAERMRIDSSGNLGIGTTTPTTALEVIGSVTCGGFTSTGIDDNATSNAITISTAERVTIDSTAGTDTLTLNRSGGTNGWATFGFPSAKFEIDAKAGFRVSVDGTLRTYTSATGLDVTGSEINLTSSTGNYLTLETTGTTAEQWIQFKDSGGATGGIKYLHSDNSMSFKANGSEAMRIDSSGNVGIGTSYPLGRLHVDGHTSSIPSIFEGNGNGDTVQVQLKVKANNGTTSVQGLYGNAGSVGTDNTICLGNSGSSGILVDNTGNVGIGTNNPSYKLHISGTGTVKSTIESTTGSGQLLLKSSTNAYTLGAVGNDFVIDDEGTAERFRITSSGNVGIGTTTPTAKLDVNGGSGNGLVVQAANAGTEYSLWSRLSNGSTALWVGGTGNVGIGTTTPSEKLEVNGNIKHQGLTMSSGTDIDQLYTVTASLNLSTTAWFDTGINAADLASGSYMVQVYVDNADVDGGNYQEFYTGIMSWYGGNPNSAVTDEIVLHRAGYAPNTGVITLRTERVLLADTNDLMLQIATTDPTTAVDDYTFKFRRMI